jgi:hypothetical protein
MIKCFKSNKKNILLYKMNNPYTQSHICNSKIHEETNTRIYDRNIPSQVLQPYLDVRPVLTKYSYFPIVDPRKKPNVPLNNAPTFNVHKVFNPGNTQSPWSGFASNINKESELRNQIYALQKCSQAVYVPNSNSDLYTYQFQPKQQHNPHNLLFQNESFGSFNPNPSPTTVGNGMFFNSTRTQVKDMTVHNN